MLRRRQKAKYTTIPWIKKRSYEELTSEQVADLRFSSRRETDGEENADELLREDEQAAAHQNPAPTKEKA